MAKNDEEEKGSGSSWLTALRRAFSSAFTRQPVKNNKNTCQEKKTESWRRWLSRKHFSSNFQLTENPTEQCHAIAVAAAAKAKDTEEIIWLNAATFRQQTSAKLIQTAFRGYIARRALIVLKGIVKLQALIRGQNVRKQANTTMKCIQALLRVQAQLHNQHARLSLDSGRRSGYAEPSNLWESNNLKGFRHRKSRCRSGSSSSIPDDWRDCPRTLQAILKARNEAALTHRAPTDHKCESIKIVEINSIKRSSFSITHGRKSCCQSPIHSQARPKSPQVNGASYRWSKEEKSYSAANTPSLRNNISTNGTDVTMPNYMAATESAKAKIRSQSAPRQRPSTPDRERERSTKKCLSYHTSDSHCVNFNGIGQKMRSPSFKSVQASHVGMEPRRNYSGPTENMVGKISRCLTMDMRRLR